MDSTRLDAPQLRLLCSMSLYRGSTSDLDLLPMQGPAVRAYTAAKALAELAAIYPGVLERSREVGMRDALRAEMAARQGGAIQLPPPFSEDATAPSAPAPMQRAA